MEGCEREPRYSGLEVPHAFERLLDEWDARLPASVVDGVRLLRRPASLPASVLELGSVDVG